MRVYSSLTGLAFIIGLTWLVTTHWGSVKAAVQDVIADEGGREAREPEAVEPEAPATRPAARRPRKAAAGVTPQRTSADVPDVGSWLEGANVSQRPRPSVPTSRPAYDLDRERRQLRKSLDMDEFSLAPEDVSGVRTAEDGSLIHLYSKGSAVVPRSLGLRGERIALSRAALRARIAITKFMQEQISVRMSDENIVDFVVDSNPESGGQETASESFKNEVAATLTSEAILRGVVTVYQEILSDGERGSLAVVVVGLSRKTLLASLSLQGRYRTSHYSKGPQGNGSHVRPAGKGVLSRPRRTTRDYLDF